MRHYQNIRDYNHRYSHWELVVPSRISPQLDKEWQTVRVPHDWAIYGPFDRANDLQSVAIEQNGEKEESIKTGRTVLLRDTILIVCQSSVMLPPNHCDQV